MAKVPVLAALVLSSFTVGCVGGGDEPPVLATIHPLAFLADRIAGDAVRVGLLVDAGAEPHAWEPSIGDVRTLGNARLVLAQGAGMEPWLDDLLETTGSPAPEVVIASRGLELIVADHEEGGHEIHGHETEENESDREAPRRPADSSVALLDLDPHTWMDPALFAEQARLVEAALVEAFPEHRATFSINGDRLVDDLNLLHQEYAVTLADCSKPFIIVNHDAYAYTARQYGFEVAAVHGLSPEGEPSSGTVRRLIELAREHNVTTVFFEEAASPRTIEVIAREVGAEVRVLYTLGTVPPELAAEGADYFSLMRVNLENLRVAMACS